MTKLKNRYLSLDVFRGLDVALMILVNSPGSYETTFSPLLHAKWHGFTLTDLVFPTFLFVVGNSMSFSMKKYESMGTSSFFKKVLKRTAIIFLLGFLMYWFPFFDDGQLKPLAETRIFGVLQRIALCYMFAAILLHYMKAKSAIIFSIVALIGYHIILVAFGDLTLTGNAVLKLDTWLIGTKHMYHGEGIAFDPEGLLSTLPAIVNVIAGYLTGRFIQQNGQNFETVSKLMMMGFALVIAGLAWDLILPINKKLWTSSFVLLTCGIDLCVLAILVYFLDMKKAKSWSYFFEVFGKNTLFIYLLSELFIISLFEIGLGSGISLYQWIADNVFISWSGGYMGSLLFALWVMLTCWVVGYIMDKKGIYVKV
ncbi:MULTISPECIES: acyltransferase family protein [Flavobacteriaceae]|uniref:acyltransferase family protein n=1 Tax=Flavobacteriaceae TaxID=49546 RepID=UPI0014910CD0|nr:MULTISPECIES: heparan-alpha-glucosaminide N-acetyltransferase domain-containing protein [Allomuricauda]MDC6367131.1 heparan-alpha-glucosaminide N-acetyltransferase domain-containing protein [Muricauda sp. AC10]